MQLYTTLLHVRNILNYRPIVIKSKKTQWTYVKSAKRKKF